MTLKFFNCVNYKQLDEANTANQLLQAQIDELKKDDIVQLDKSADLANEQESDFAHDEFSTLVKTNEQETFEQFDARIVNVFEKLDERQEWLVNFRTAYQAQE